MPLPAFTRADVRTKINDKVKGTLTSTESNRVINDAAREVGRTVDLYSMKRRAPLVIDGANHDPFESYSGVPGATTLTSIEAEQAKYEFHLPTDLKGDTVIDIRSQYGRSSGDSFEMTLPESFERRKGGYDNQVAIDRNSFMGRLLVSNITDVTSIVIHDCDTVAGNGTWTPSDDASSAATETSNFVEGNGAVTFDTTGTTTNPLTMTNSGFTAVDLSDMDEYSIFMWVYIPEATGITNFILRWGSDASNYYSRTVIKTVDGLGFFNGWNLLRFPVTDATETGTVVDTSIGYLRLQVTKDATHTDATNWIIDNIVARKSTAHDVVYYGKNPWLTTANVYLSEASGDTDYILADENELDMIIYKGAEFSSDKLGDEAGVLKYRALFNDAVKTYTSNHPSERLVISTIYYNIGEPDNNTSDD